MTSSMMKFFAVPKETFRRVRAKLDLTQAETASMFGFSGPTVISNIETGFRNPNRTALVILKLLDRLPKKEARKLAKQLVTQSKNL